MRLLFLIVLCGYFFNVCPVRLVSLFYVLRKLGKKVSRKIFLEKIVLENSQPMEHICFVYSRFNPCHSPHLTTSLDIQFLFYPVTADGKPFQQKKHRLQKEGGALVFIALMIICLLWQHILRQLIILDSTYYNLRFFTCQYLMKNLL